MKSLYSDLVSHFARKKVSAEEFQTGNFTGSFAVVSTERSLFQGLIDFCEKELEFQRPKKLRGAITRKEEQYRSEQAATAQKLQKATLLAFGKLPKLRKPSDHKVISRLEVKLHEYMSRRAKTFKAPDLAFAVEEGYRDTVYKIEILSSVLALEKGKKLDLKKMVLGAIQQRKEYFFPDEYFNASAVIAHYLGAPFKGSNVQKELPVVA
jgi:hypothetical protein